MRTKVTPEIESQMRELRAQGMLDPGIAKRLGVGVHTVYLHLNPEQAKKQAERHKKWYETHPGYGKEARKKQWAAYCEYYNERNRKTRLAVIKLLGGCCADCGNTDPRVLQINHINGDSKKDRERYSNNQGLYKAILCGERPIDDLNLLCANCNILYDYDTGRRKHVTPEHLAVIELLGGKCANCGNTDPRVLQVNHVDGGGNIEYKAYRSFRGLYRVILNGERPINDLNLLCGNCNVLYEYERKERR